jgi:hypothetical protein
MIGRLWGPPAAAQLPREACTLTRRLAALSTSNPLLLSGIEIVPAQIVYSIRFAWSPNPRLQWTRFALLRAPLSRKPLGRTSRGAFCVCGTRW